MSTKTRAFRILAKLGEDALKKGTHTDGKWRHAPLSARQRAHLRNHHLRNGLEWPFEHIYPGIKSPKEPPVKKGKKWQKEKEERLKRIEENMKDMPRLIAEYKESRKIKDVPLIDKLLLRPKQIREKVKSGRK